MGTQKQCWSQRVRRGRMWLALLAGALLVSIAAPAQASMTMTRFMERDGQTVIVSQTVGNQSFRVHWAENDPRRHADDGLSLYYRIDQTELPPGISWEDTETAIESAVATFNSITCGKNIQLVRMPSSPGEDLGFAQNLVGLGGDDMPVADITFAGWVPQEFFAAYGVPDANGLTVPAAFDADEQSLVWGPQAVLDPERLLSDIDRDGNGDLFATEIYFTTGANYVVDDDELGNTLFYIDLESIVLHELGHALGMDHFGRTTVILDESGNFVDLILNENSVNLMNTNNYFVKQDLSGSDVGSFCGLYGSWGKGHAGTQ